MVARTTGVGLVSALLIGTCAPGWAGQAFDACFDQQAARYGLDAGLLRSIAVVESGMRPHVDNHSQLARTGTSDIGLMQINTSWLPVLAPYGIAKADLRDPCTSIEVGAWILWDLLRRYGNTWEALGAYNAACTQLKGSACQQARTAYAWRVWRAWQRQEGAEPAPDSRSGDRRVNASDGRTFRGTGLVAISATPLAVSAELTP
jgi:hypothetical protein